MLYVLLIFAMVLILGVTIHSFSSSKIYYGKVRGTPPFETVGGRTISYEELMKFIVFRNLTIYLPSWLPQDFSLTAIWARDSSHGLEFPLIIVYSRGNVTDYRAREDNLVMEVMKASPAPLKQYIEDGATPIYDANGKLIGVLLRDAYCPTCTSWKTLSLAMVRIDGLDYLISFRDTSTLLKIVHSMKQLSIKQLLS